MVPGRSAVLVKAQSNVGPISFATSDLAGSISMHVRSSEVDLSEYVEGHLSIPLDRLTSGDRVYDAELRRRIQTHRFPYAHVVLSTVRKAEGEGEGGIYELTGEMEFHNRRLVFTGKVTVAIEGDEVVVRGEQPFDIRDFGIDPPATIALTIYPEVVVQMHIEARAE